MTLYKKYFISATGTDVGKTFISALLLKCLTLQGQKVHYWKPFQTGSIYDLDSIKSLLGPHHPCYESLYNLDFGTSIDRAAKKEDLQIDIEKVKKIFYLQKNHCLIEGAGGVMVPLLTDYYFRDLVFELNIEVLLVTTSQVGTINHTILTINALKEKNIKIGALFINGNDDFELDHYFLTLWPKIPIIRVPHEKNLLSHNQINAVMNSVWFRDWRKNFEPTFKA